jgi:hypothetical protein
VVRSSGAGLRFFDLYGKAKGTGTDRHHCGELFEMPMTEPRLSREAIYERDAGVCQYTGEFVGRSGNLDHVVPRARGGRDSFENLVWSKRRVNSEKPDRLPSEVGLRLIRSPRAPKRVPVSTTITEIRHPDWQHFIQNHRVSPR